jgi:hypothetical protein
MSTTAEDRGSRAGPRAARMGFRAQEERDNQLNESAPG